MTITNQPLWYDISSHQGEIKYAKLPEGPAVHGIISRAGVGLNKDVQFLRNWEKTGEHVRYRSSYWAIWPELDCDLQLARWYEQCPTVDLIPRVIDLEHLADMDNDGDLDPHDYLLIASTILRWAAEILLRDGILPWIYSRKNILDKIFTFLLDDEVNMFYYILAEYNNWRHVEEDGINLPNRVDASRVLFKQTADMIPPDPLGLAPESAAIDRDRWLLGDEAQMHQWIEEQYTNNGGDTTTPVGDCAELGEILDNFIIGYAEDYNQMDEDVYKLEQSTQKNTESIDMLWEAGGKSDIYLNKLDNVIQANDADIDTLFEEIESVNKKSVVNSSGIADLYKRLESMSVNNTETLVGKNGVYERIEELESKISGMEGGHNHPAWFKKLRLLF